MPEMYGTLSVDSEVYETISYNKWKIQEEINQKQIFVEEADPWHAEVWEMIRLRSDLRFMMSRM